MYIWHTYACHIYVERERKVEFSILKLEYLSEYNNDSFIPSNKLVFSSFMKKV